MEIGDRLEIRDKGDATSAPLKGTLEAIDNNHLGIRAGKPYYQLIWIDKRRYDIKVIQG